LNSEKQEFEFTAKTLFGLEELLAKELQELGAENVRIVKRAVTFQGEDDILYKANYCCRTALRVLKPVLSFRIKKQRDLYNQVFEIPWEEIFSIDKTMMIDSVVYSHHFRNTHFAAQLAKDAIADRFRYFFDKRPNVDKDDPDIRINIHIARDDCTVSMDASGHSLHLRGYRQKTVEAPLNEVLAAAMVSFSGWNGRDQFVDPCCGSGTLLIEAAMAAKKIPAGYFRQKYSMFNWKGFDRKLWDKIKQEADEKIEQRNLKIFGSDKSPRAIVAARVNIRHSGLQRDITTTEKPFQELTRFEPPGVVMANPPYGERLNVQNNHILYEQLGDLLKRAFPGYSAWILSADIESLKHIGLKSSSKIKLFNGPLECRFVNFDMYEGSKE
jgi:putative N6-adenine-specific DNA methylase